MIFVKNNIKFRQVSSLAQSDFLRSKSFMLNEVQKAEKHIFSSTAKEILLQTYKVWTDLLMVAEEFFVTNSKTVCDADSLEFLFFEAKKRNEELRKHLVNHPEWFDPSFISVWLEIQEARKDQVKDSLYRQSLGQSSTAAYSNMTKYLMTFMNHILFTLHEVDYLLYFKDTEDFRPFVYIDSVDVNFNVTSGKCYSAERVAIYRAKDLLKVESIDIKNGFRKEQLEETGFDKAYRAVLSEIESLGMTIRHIM